MIDITKSNENININDRLNKLEKFMKKTNIKKYMKKTKFYENKNIVSNQILILKEENQKLNLKN